MVLRGRNIADAAFEVVLPVSDQLGMKLKLQVHLVPQLNATQV